MKKIISIVLLCAAFSGTIKAQSRPIDRIHYQDPITGQMMQGWEAIGNWAFQNGEYVMLTITGVLLTPTLINDRKQGTCRITWRDKRRSKRRQRRNRR